MSRDKNDYSPEAEKALRVILTPKRMLLLNIMEAESELDRATAINRYELDYVKPLEAKALAQTEELQDARLKVKYCNKLVDRELSKDEYVGVPYATQ